MHSFAIDLSPPAVSYGDLTKKSAKRQTTQRRSSRRDAAAVAVDGSGAAVSAQTGRINLVIKNKVFDATLVSHDADVIDFRDAEVHGQLLYYASGEEVEFVKEAPLSYTLKPSRNGKRCEVEVKIAVLSSQKEHSLFTVRFCANGKEQISEPIKVVSKRSQLEKGPAKRRRTTQVATREAVLHMIEKVDASNTKQDERMHALEAKIEQQNAMLQALMQKIEELSSNNNNNNNDNAMQQDDSCDYSYFSGEEEDDDEPGYSPDEERQNHDATKQSPGTTPCDTKRRGTKRAREQCDTTTTTNALTTSTATAAPFFFEAPIVQHSVEQANAMLDAELVSLPPLTFDPKEIDEYATMDWKNSSLMHIDLLDEYLFGSTV